MTPERRQLSESGVFFVTFEHISHLVLVFFGNFEHVIDGWVGLFRNCFDRKNFKFLLKKSSSLNV